MTSVPSNRLVRRAAAMVRAALVVALSLAACGPGRAVDARWTLTIFAAASLTDAFTELAQAFEAANPTADVLLNFAGSSQLAAQLREGAQADLFASADPAQLAAVVADGRIAAGQEVPFATNTLTAIVPADNPARITTFDDLARPGVQLLLAVPGVPVRAYTDAAMAALPPAFQDGFYANLVSEEDNVRQVAAKIALGEADAGIVYTSDITPDIAGRVVAVALPDAATVRAVYPIAPLIDAAQPALAQQFIDFVLSDAGQAILARWGFGSASAEAG